MASKSNGKKQRTGTHNSATKRRRDSISDMWEAVGDSIWESRPPGISG